MRYSALSILTNALRGNKNWKPAWRAPDPKPYYDVIIVGGGGHGLATAYYLAKEFGICNVAVLEKGYIGSGNVGRNTTIIRSNYLLPGNNPFYEFSMKLWEGLEQDINFNAMVSQRGVLNLYHSDAQRDAYIRRGNAMRLHGVDADLLDASRSRRWCPFSITTMRGFRSWAGCCRSVAVPCVMTVSPGAMRGVRTAAASTSSRIAKSQASGRKMARSSVSRPRAVSSAAQNSDWPRRAIPRASRKWRA
jgi:glycine/D-amino acid oxidase-like deaminating enzyme